MNKATVLAAMAMAANAYTDEPPGAALSGPLYSSPGGVQFYARRQEDTLWLVFRGSNSPLDWAHNLAFFKLEIPYGNPESAVRVHRGFLYGYKSPYVRGRIHGLVQGAQHIKLSGHSYGAALATLCALDIQYNFPKKDIEVCLFGSPRVGNKAFMRSYNKRVVKTLRVENGNDVVTRVPFAIMGFRHVGARYPVGRPRLPFVLSAADHYPSAYYQSLLQRLLP